jgi:YD repeat-containing protein
MGYDTIHNIVSKDQRHVAVQPSGAEVESHKTSYDWAYAYGSVKPHAPTLIGERAFSYDANGNQAGWEHVANGTRRTITWDEENRIQAVADNGHTMRYKYDDAGTRVIKRG